LSDNKVISWPSMQRYYPRNLAPLSGVIFLLPLLVAWIFKLPRIMFQNFTDSVFYLAYAMHFNELIDRVGITYYCTRFGAILPDAIAFTLFGPTAGFSIVRYGFSGACCTILFLLFTKRYNLATGILAAFCWIFNPVALRLLQMGYVDAAGTAYLLLGICLLLFPRVSLLAAFGSGILFGLTIWSHLHAAIALFFFLPLALLVHRDKGVTRVTALVGCVMGGIVLVSLGGALFFYSQYGFANIASPYIELLKALSHEYAQWKEPWGIIFRRGICWFVPIPLTIAAFLCFRRDSLVLGAVIAVDLFAGFLWYGDIFHNGFSLTSSDYHYFSFLFPAYVIAVTSMSANFLRDKPFKHLVVFLLAVITPTLVAVLTPGFDLIVPVIFISLVVVTIAGVTLLSSEWRGIAVALVLTTANSLIAVTPSFDIALGKYWKADDTNLFRIGQELIKKLPKASEDPSILRFWYKDEVGSNERMIQSLYLHHFTKLMDKNRVTIPFGLISDRQAKDVASGGIRHIVILDHDSVVIDQGIQYITDAGLIVDSVNKFYLQAGAEKINVAHIKIKPQALKNERKISLDTILLNELILASKNNSVRASKLDHGISVSTPEAKWSYVFIPLPPLKEGEGVSLTFQVTKGRIKLGLSEDNQATGSYPEQEYASSSHMFETVLMPDNAHKKYLALTNVFVEGEESSITIENIKVGTLN